MLMDYGFQYTIQKCKGEYLKSIAKLLPIVSTTLKDSFMCSNSLCQSTTSTPDQMCDPECAAIVLGVLAAILLILLVVAITGWVCTYCILMKKLKQSVKNNSR